MKKLEREKGYIALTATIIISLILLVITIEEGASGWHARFNILSTEAKEQANNLAEGCVEQAIAKILTDPSYIGNSTTTYPLGVCHIFPIEFNSPNPGLLTIKTQAVVRNSYTNLKIVLNKNSILYGNTGFISPENNTPDTGGDGNGFEINPNNAFVDGVSGINSSAQNINGPGDRHRFSGYNFNIPQNATITGIQVKLDWWINSTNGTNSINVELSWDGGISWTQYKNTLTESTSVNNSEIIGGPTDIWGRVWTRDEFNPSNFIVRITTNSSVSSRDFYLDWIPVSVNYLTNVNNVSGSNFFITPIESWEEVPQL